MLKLKIQNQNVKLKVEKATGIDIILGICRLYICLMENGIEKKAIDKQVKEVLNSMLEEKEENNG